MSEVAFYVRLNGQWGVSVDNVRDAGYSAEILEGVYTIWNHDGDCILSEGSRAEAERAILEDWNSK